MLPTLAEIENRLQQIDRASLQPLQITVLSGVIVETLKTYLEFLASECGLNAKVRFGEYNAVFREAVSGSPDLLNDKTDVVIIFTPLETLSPDLAWHAAGRTAEELGAECDRVEQWFSSVLKGIRRQSSAMILWQGLETEMYPALGIYDDQRDEGQRGCIARLNAFLRESLVDNRNAFFVNTDRSLITVGLNSFYDHRYRHIARAPYSRAALCEIAQYNMRYIRAYKGRNKKCLVLDCDNTLWGGIVGEDGLAGIKLGATHPGSAYREFQQEIVTLYNRGVVIALCSKNNEQDVWDIFDQHPDMVLKREHIAAAQINWDDKATNLLRLAEELNLGLDSMVFLDDSEFEIGLVQQLRPEVMTVLLPSAESTRYREILASCGWFDTLRITDEDRKRGSMYRAEAQRRRHRAAANSLEEYYRSLEMDVDVVLADSYTLPRIAQQMERTNQFNLTTVRHSEQDLYAFLANPFSDVLAVRLRDRFGDSGVIGAAVLRYEESTATIDSFVLSCRVLGRGIEDVLLQSILSLASARGCKKAIGLYRETRKNAQVADFYARRGGEVMAIVPEGFTKAFAFDLALTLPPLPKYFKNIMNCLN